MNIVTLVGRLVENPEIKELNDGNYKMTITLAVPRDYKNNDGKYDADFIKCVLWNKVASATNDYCHKGNVIGVKGKLQTRVYENEDKESKWILEVIAEKVMFISTFQDKNA